MSWMRLLLRSLCYHWRGNSAVLLGVAVGTAVLAGALLVGDSLRGSLRDLTLRQLEWVDYALVTGRLIREKLATELPAERVCPALLLQGSISTTPSSAESTDALPRRLGHITIWGVDDRFWAKGQPPVDDSFWTLGASKDSEKSGVVLSASLARELDVHAGDTIVLHLQKASSIPRESLLGRRNVEDVVIKLPAVVRAVLTEDQPGGWFSLNPTPAAPRNAWVPLHLLQARLGIKSKVNVLLVRGVSAPLQDALRQHLMLEDWNLVIHDPDSRVDDLFRKLDRDGDGKLSRKEWGDRIAESLVRAMDAQGNSVLKREEVTAFYRKHHGYLSLENEQLLLDPTVAAATATAARTTKMRTAPTLVYLANRIAEGKESIPYSIVAALDPVQPPPLGPFVPSGVSSLQQDEIILADWKESPLQAKPGDTITLSYFLPEEGGRLGEKTASFRLRGKIPLQGTALDPDLTPAFPGITDKLDIRDWNPPFPYDNKRIQPRDDHFWKAYRTTPKAYITLARGQELWNSRFGRLTSIRLAPENAETPVADWKALAATFGRHLLENLTPEQGGLIFDAVRERSLEAGVGGNDFGILFLSFSFFLIVAALLLVGLLFRLNLDRRAAEIGLLLATGFSQRQVRRLSLAEGALLATGGVVLGLVAALLYAWSLLDLLSSLWPGGLDRSLLHLHVTYPSLLVGAISSWLAGMLAMAWAVRVLGKVAPRALLQGETTDTNDPSTWDRRSVWGFRIVCISLCGAVLSLVGTRFVTDSEMQAMLFFTSGFLLLTACLALVWTWMRGTRHAQVHGRGVTALARLSLRNASRHPVRSLLTVGLLAAAAFLLVAVESFRPHSGDDFLERHSGSGGFALLAETDIPVFQDLNGPDGQAEMSDALERRLHDMDPNKAPSRLQSMQTLLRQVSFQPFRLHLGDDASCLNLYRPSRPRLLGVPASLIERGGFHFAAVEAHTPEGRANPWLLLTRKFDDGCIPVFGEKNTVEWMLKSGLGNTLEIKNEHGERILLRIVGLLQNSVFQSGLLMSEANFLKLYPRRQGYNFFLIDTQQQSPKEVKSVLETALADHGLEATSTKRQLEAYLAVEGMYLSTFQALGAFGLFLGTLGLAVVLLRSIWERRGELALLRALGYRHAALGWLLLAENGFLLVLGIGVGAIAALLAVAPHMFGGAGQIPWLGLLGLFAVVLVIGLAAGTAAMVVTLRAPLLPALRRE